MNDKTEKEILTEIAKRLGVLAAEFSTEKEITIRAYYDITVRFDGVGKVIEFDSHP